jgi:hypothetical protein
MRLFGKKGACSVKTIYILRRNERQKDFSLVKSPFLSCGSICSETSMLHFFANLCTLAWSQPNAHDNNVKLFTFSVNLLFIFVVLHTKIYSLLHFVVQFSQFLIWDNNGPPSVLAVTNMSVWKYVSSGVMHSCKWFMWAPCDFTTC